MIPGRFKNGIQWWMDTKTYGACPNPPQWHIDTGNLVRLVPQREWVGLTGGELADLWYKESLDWMEFARAHEAKLKEKNFD